MEILRQLLFHPGIRFTDLNISGLTSDHLTYHISELLALKLVRKEEKGRYSLTMKGKELANTMDTDKAIIEKQPKVAVMVIVEKVINRKKHLLIQTRLKEPYYGFKGFLTGKVRFGEKLLEAAARELEEETSLTATLDLRFILHELVYSVEGELLEDKIFHIIRGVDPVGELRDFEGGTNEWLPWSDYLKIEKRFKDDDAIFSNYDKTPKEFYVEKTYIAQEF